MAKRPSKAATRVSDEAMVRATTKTLAEWFALFDAEHAHLWSHKERVGFLRRHDVTMGWWQQVITVNYERARGLRLLGEAKGAGFEVGISHTYPIDPETAWKRLTEAPGFNIWAGEGVTVELKKGAFQEGQGKRVEVRGVTPGVRVRLSITEPNVPQRTIQMSIVPAAEGKSSVRFHEENLPGLGAKKRAEKRWQDVMDDVAGILAY